MSASQNEATMGGMLGHAQNGSATDTYNNLKYRGNQD